MAQDRDVIVTGYVRKLGRQLVDADGFIFRTTGNRRSLEQALVIQWLQQRVPLCQRAQTVKPHDIQALEDVAALAVLRQAPVLVDKTLNFLESGNDALLDGRTPALFSGGRTRPVRRPDRPDRDYS